MQTVLMAELPLKQKQEKKRKKDCHLTIRLSLSVYNFAVKTQIFSANPYASSTVKFYPDEYY